MNAPSIAFEAVLEKLLEYLLIAGGLAGVFVTPRRWFHWLGLVTLPTLYLGGFVLGVSVYVTYNADPSLSGRYGLALAPMLVVALVASIRGVWIVRGLWAFGLLTLVSSLYFMLGR